MDVPVGSPGARFHLFLSYSRDSDYRLARAIESFLESFHTRLPRRAAETLEPLSPLQVCVDGNDFSLPPRRGQGDDSRGRDVPQVIVDHLAQSWELLVLCSGGARQSRWVAQEIDWFLEQRGPGAIRLALTEGADPLATPDEFLPAALVERGLHRSVCYDLRGYYRGRARTWAKVNDFDRELVRLAADLHGRAAGDVYPLWLEEARRRSRRTAWLRTAAVGLILSGVLAAVYFGKSAQTERAVSRQKDAEARAAHAETVAAKAETEKASALARAEEDQRKAAEANARTEAALRQVAAAFERLYRTPFEALHLAESVHDPSAATAARRALEAAYRVALLRHENRRESSQLTGSGPAYLARRWKQGGVFSVIDPSGRHVLLVTERGRDGVTGPRGQPLPGEVYLLDNETLRLRRLPACDGDIMRRVEHADFSTSGDHVFVTRHYNLHVYTLDGSCVATYGFSRYTKSPVHLVDGYLAGGWLVGADSKGGVWLAHPETQQSQEVRSEWFRDPVTSLAFVPSGRRFILLSASGRATLCTWTGQGKPIQKDIASTGVIAAAFHPRRDDVFVTTGDGGVVRTWKINGEQLAATEAFELGRIVVDSATYTQDGSRLLAVADDGAAYLLEPGTRKSPVRIDLSGLIDWGSVRVVPNNFARSVLPRPEAPGKTIALADFRIRVAKVTQIEGKQWLFTVTDPEDVFAKGAVYLVEGDRAVAIPGRDIPIGLVESRAGAVWLRGWSGDTYRLSDRGVVPLPSAAGGVHFIESIRGGMWLGTTGGLYRMEGEDLVRLAPTDLSVTGIREIDGAMWLATTSGAYVLESDRRLIQVTEDFRKIASIQKIGGRIWITDAGDPPGPAWMVRGYRVRPMPDRRAGVLKIVEAGGRAWLATTNGLYRADGDTVELMSGPNSRITDVRVLGGEVWAFQAQFWSSTSLAWRARGNALAPVPATGVLVRDAGQFGGRLWVTTRRSLPESFAPPGPGPLYRVDGERVTAVPDERTRIAEIQEIAGRVWVRVERVPDVYGAAWVNGNQLRPVDTGEGSVTRIQALRDKAWILTTRGAYLLEEGDVRLVGPKTFDARNAVEHGGQLWVLGVGGALRVGGGSPGFFPTGNREVVQARNAVGRTWLLTRGGVFEPGPAYLVDGDGARPVPDETVGVTDVVELGGAAWLVTRVGGKPGPLHRVPAG